MTFSILRQPVSRLEINARTVMLLAAALLLISITVGVLTDRSSRIERAREAQVQAEILASSVAGALAFDDKIAAQEYLDALRASPAIEAAGAYDLKGGITSSLTRTGNGPPSANRIGPARYHDGKLEVTSPVKQGTTMLGSVYLRLATETLPQRLTRYLAVAAIIIMALLLILGLGSSHARLHEAHAKLQQEIWEREQAEDRLRQAQKMEAMGQLTGGVAHDFNNLLMIASSGLDLMDRTQDPERREKLKQGIRHAIDRGASLTQQLLAFARRAPIKPEVISPPLAMAGMLNLLERSLREDVTVNLQLEADLWLIEVDPSAFEVAILNLALNARDAMPAGGVITLKAQNVPASEGAGHDMVRVSVTDTGLGLSPELAARVFEPFFTTKSVGQGTGLGLSQVYGFAHSSGGDVQFTSEVGRGTTVCISLPRSAKHPPAGSKLVPSAGPRDGGRRRVLLVEDDDAVAQMVLGMLAELDFETVRAINADDALLRLEADDRFDVVFSDMVMPGKLNGLDLAHEIRNQRPAVPIVLTTGYSAAAVSVEAEGVRLLLKPYRIDALATALTEAIARRLVA